MASSPVSLDKTSLAAPQDHCNSLLIVGFDNKQATAVKVPPDNQSRVVSPGQKLFLPISKQKASSIEAAVVVTDAFAKLPESDREILQWHESYDSIYDIQRYDNGEEIYRGRVWAARLAENEEVARELLELGAKLTDQDGQSVLVMPEFNTFFKKYYTHAIDLMKSGVLHEDDLILPCLVFINKAPTQVFAKDYVFVRPGIDPWPDPNHFKLMSLAVDIPHDEWENLVSSGYMPIGLGNMQEHDLSHLTEMFHDPELMKATRRYYQAAVSRPQNWRRALKVDLNYNHNPATLHFLRVFFLAEAFSVPNLSKSNEIKTLIPDFFADKGPRTLSEAKARLSRLRPQERLDEIEKIAKTSKSQEKHGVSKEEVESIFDLKLAVPIGRQVSPPVDEERLCIVGPSFDGRLISVVFTLRDGRVRPISSRTASRKERKLYEDLRKAT